MRRSWMGLGLLVILLAVWPALPAGGQTVAPTSQLTLDRWVSTTGAEFAGGALAGTVLITNTVVLTSTTVVTSTAMINGMTVISWTEETTSTVVMGRVQLAAGKSWGVYTSPAWEAPTPCHAAGLLYHGSVPAGAALYFEVRAGNDAGEWTAWTPVPPGSWTDPSGLQAGETLVEFSRPQKLLQYRVTFSGKATPVLEGVVVVALGAGRVPEVEARPPWQESDALPRPVPPAQWGSLPSAVQAQTVTITPSVVLVQPATWAMAAPGEAVAALALLQLYQREVLGWDDMPYRYLVDRQGRIYEGRPQLTDEVLQIGLLGAHPHEVTSPTAEDALVALIDWWAEALPPGGAGVTVLAPDDPLLAERIQARREVGALRRNEWFLARGLSGTDTDTWILLANPDGTYAVVTAEMYQGGSRIVRRLVWVAGLSRASLLADNMVPAGDFWTRISANGNILVERAIYFGPDGDDSTGLEVLSRQWYVPAGSQEPGFTTTLTLLNPGNTWLTATVTVYGQSGPAGEAAVPLAPRTRLDLPMSELYTRTTPLGLRVTATGLIAVEQAVRFLGGGAGYALPGTPVLSRHWTLAGVETEGSALTVLALLNPHPTPVTITLTLMSEDGTTLRRPYTVQPGEQRLNLNVLLPELALAAEVLSNRPIAVARVTFFNDLHAAQATLGAVRPARQWYLPEGSTGEPFETFILLANPNDWSTKVTLTFMGGNGVLDQLHLAMPPHSRLTVPLNEVLPDTDGFYTVVVADRPVVVERSMYLHDRQGGHASLGIAR